MKNFALVSAAGSAKRFGGQTPKQYLELSGRPVLYHCLRPFCQHPQIEAVVVVVRQAELAQVRDWISTWQLSKVMAVIAGGVYRQDSVAEGLKVLAAVDGNVLVHDGSRPCLSRALLDRILEAGKSAEGVIPGVPVRETLKRVDDNGVILETAERQGLWQVQTPQLFRLPVLRQAVSQATKENFYGTDEAMLVERLGQPVKVVEGDIWNIKLTFPQDLALAAAWLENKKGSEPGD